MVKGLILQGASMVAEKKMVLNMTSYAYDMVVFKESPTVPRQNGISYICILTEQPPPEFNWKPKFLTYMLLHS
jgi:hypothetical protein